MTQSRYLLATVIIFFSLTLFWGIFTPQVLPNREANWVSGMYKVKEEKARSINESKLVIVSGSSGLFGLSAQNIESRLGIPTVNLATHAGLGAKYLLFRARQSLRPGDIVLLALEYELLAPQEELGPFLAGFVSAYDLRFAANVPLAWIPGLLVGHDYKSFIWSIAERFGLWRYKQACYGSTRTLNEFGDEMCAETNEFKSGDLKRLFAQGVIKPEVINPSTLNPEILNFFHWARTKNVRVYFGFPPLFERPEYALISYKKSFDMLVRRLGNLDVTVLGKPENFFYPADYIYDTRYHLHSKGRDVHTNRMLKLICEGGFTCTK